MILQTSSSLRYAVLTAVASASKTFKTLNIGLSSSLILTATYPPGSTMTEATPALQDLVVTLHPLMRSNIQHKSAFQFLSITGSAIMKWLVTASWHRNKVRHIM